MEEEKNNDMHGTKTIDHVELDHHFHISSEARIHESQALQLEG